MNPKPVPPLEGDEERVLSVMQRLQDANTTQGGEVTIYTSEIGAVLNALIFATLPRDVEIGERVPVDKTGVHDHRDEWEKGPGRS